VITVFHAQFTSSNDAEFYRQLHSHAHYLFSLERDWLANLSNSAALIGLNMRQINWVGFYLWRSEHLLLGPFWGKPACTRILLGTGVCGTAAATLQPQLVDDVHLFPGHIPCDEASQSEMVIPFTSLDGRLIGVLDIDAPVKARFNAEDLGGMTRFLSFLSAACDWESML